LAEGVLALRTFLHDDVVHTTFRGFLMRLRIAALVLTAATVMQAEVRLPNVYSDHAVLQRDMPIHIWGLGAPAEHVTVQFHNQKMEATASPLGLWELSLQPEKAGGPYTLHVTSNMSTTAIDRTDLLVGDVWFASGQSNMEMPLKGFATAPIKDSEKEISAANYPKIRLLLQKKRAAPAPMLDTEDTWKVCTPDTARDFSAAAYFFGRKIMQEENVPIGLIDSTWGGTPAHSWISTEGLAWSNLPSVAVDAGKIVREQGLANSLRENFNTQEAAMKAAGKPPVTRPRFTDRAGAWNPAGLFNGMIAPFTGYTVRGFLWYQGETDHEGIKALNYSRVFPALIQDWRKQWGEGPLPFFFVQIASYDSPGDEWADVRDAQRRTLELINTGMAVALDIGLEKNIHPPDKQTVGARLAQSALGISYGHKVETASPNLMSVGLEGSSIRAYLTHADGLKAAGELTDFQIAGSDGKFVNASAKIEILNGQSTVIATAPSVESPKYIRYGWAPYVRTYLYNSAGLPLGTFTSESDAEMQVK
jgi:sialate O-acetylesterase